MKCEHCGSNISIENKYCPNCAQPNIHYVEHREEMERYKNDYFETKSEILDKTKWYNKAAVSVSIIAVLVALVILMAFLLTQEGKLTRFVIEKNNASHYDEYSRIIDSFIENNQYNELHYFMYGKNMSIPRESSVYSDYRDVCRAAEYYEYLYGFSISLLQGDYSKGISGYSEMVASTSESLYKMENVDEYTKKEHPNRRTPEKQAFIENCINDAEYMIQAMSGLSDEEMEKYKKASTSKKATMIEEAIINYGK